MVGGIAGPLDRKINAIATAYTNFFETFGVMGGTFEPTRQKSRLRF
jgi:hypothetical protein